MTTGEQRRAEDTAGEYWDALNQGVPRTEVPDLDPSLASIIDRVRTLDDARSPDLDFVTRLEQQIMRSSASTWFDLSVSQTNPTGAANGHREGLGMPLSLPRVDRPRAALDGVPGHGGPAAADAGRRLSRLRRSAASASAGHHAGRHPGHPGHPRRQSVS
jgi:hypothetical protein